MLGCTWYRAASSAIVPSPRIAARATLALKSGEKLRRFAIVVRSSHQRKYHLTTLSEFWGPLLLDRIEYNKRENQPLARARDLLLPKLMSGEIRLSEAENIVMRLRNVFSSKELNAEATRAC